MHHAPRSHRSTLAQLGGRLITAVLLGTAAAPSRLGAQPIAPTFGDAAGVSWVHESWTVRDGLPVNSVNGLLQDRDGYIWAATFDGLVRFDGARFTVFNTANSEGLPSNRILRLRETRDGALLLETEQHDLVRFRNGRFTPIVPRRDGLAQLERAVTASPANTLWLSQLGEAYGLAGETSRAREILGQLESRARESSVSPYHFAYTYTGLGETDRALDLLERAVAERAGPAYGIKGSFLFASLHEHPRFRELLRGMQLTP